MTLASWVTSYTAALPPHLRPPPENRHFQDTARQAQRNGWTPQQAARLVANINYDQALHPHLMAVTELARMTSHPPPRAIPERAPHSDDACPWPQCRCTHTHPCHRGWIDTDDGPTTPCPECRPQLAHRIARTPAPGRRTPADHAYIRGRDPNA